ncbi:hypothetical protein SDC9_161550 [bioreactor metagenome]|uniref:Uncharacterized protein n=1 Tax=bioreactor metagenome TaxID=1076179 RepID=A0A645FPR0_9ZZZZ
MSYRHAQSGTKNTPGRHTEMPVDEDITHNHIDHVGNNVIRHGDFGSPNTAQTSRYGKGKRIGREGEHEHLHIQSSTGYGIRLVGSHEHDHGFGEDIAQETHDQRSNKREHQTLMHNGIGIFVIAGTLCSSDKRGAAGVEGLENSQDEEAWLGDIPNCGNGRRSYTADHHGVDHTDQLD